jgi:hypothetical protein
MHQLKIRTTKQRTCAKCNRVISAYHPAIIDTESIGQGRKTEIYHISCVKGGKHGREIL